MAFDNSLGLNYGHQGGTFDSLKQADLNYLWACGVRRLRIAYPQFNTTTLNVNSKNLVVAALNKGFYVIWGSTGGSNLTSTTWSTYKNYVITNIVPWAQALQNPNLQLSLGNEEELHVDGTTLLATDIMADLTGAYGTSAKAGYTYGPISYETAATFRATWATNGKGPLDKVGFNVYYETDPNGTSKLSAIAIAKNTFTGAYISEWNTNSGFPDAISASPMAEQWWRDNLLARYKIIKSLGLESYCFAFCDGGFGVPANSYGLRTTDNNYRLAWEALAQRRISQV